MSRIPENLLDEVIEGKLVPDHNGVIRLALDLRDERKKSKNFARDLDNLRGDAETAGAEFSLWLAAFRFDNGHGSVMLDYVPFEHATRGPMNAEDLEAISRTLRSMGWKTEIGGDDDGITRVCVEVKG